MIKKHQSKPFYYSILLLAIYLLLEISLYCYNFYRINFGNINFEAINKKNIVFDKIRGFRFKSGCARTVLISNSELEFDTYFCINNVGIPARKNYQLKKNKNIKRHIVFGDSHTQGYFLNRNWPDIVDSILQESNIEFYNFAVDGGGLVNWHNIFFNEIINNYEFDGVIFAVYGDNFNRDFWVVNPVYEKNLTRAGYVDKIPKDYEDLDKNFSLMEGRNLYKDDGEINFWVENLQRKKITFPKIKFYSIDFYFELKKIFNYLCYIINLKNKDLESNDIVSKYDKEEFKKRYGSVKLNLLEKIIFKIQETNKDIVFVNIPDKEDAKHFNLKKSHILKQELKFLSDYYDCNYFDSFNLFSEHNNDLESFWFKYDGHLNQEGSKVFSAEFSKYIMEINN